MFFTNYHPSTTDVTPPKALNRAFKLSQALAQALKVVDKNYRHQRSGKRGKLVTIFSVLAVVLFVAGMLKKKRKTAFDKDYQMDDS